MRRRRRRGSVWNRGNSSSRSGYTRKPSRSAPPSSKISRRKPRSGSPRRKPKQLVRVRARAPSRRILLPFSLPRYPMARRIYDSMPASRENWERLKNAGGNLVKALRIQMAVKGLSSEVYKDIIDPIMADPTSLIHSDEIAWQSLREEQEREANNYLHHNINRNATWVPEPTKEEKDAQDFLQSQEEAAKESAKAQGKAMTGAIAPTRSTGRALPPPPPAESGLGVGPLTSPFMTPSMWMGR